MSTDAYLDLADWRRRMAAMWAEWRLTSTTDPEAATLAFRAAKDRLFREHPQSPLPAEARASFAGLDHWPYDPSWRMVVPLEPVDAVPGPHDDVAAVPGSGLSGGSLALPSSGTGAISFRRIGRVRLAGPLEGRALSVFWIEGYAGGLFLPFRDATSGTETYGAGRYLLDTVKSADHGIDPDTGDLVLDFNLAYHPSCAYDPRWSCPLAPPENTLPVAVPVGERLRP